MVAKTETKPDAAEITFAAPLHLIPQRGRPPIPFLRELVSWGKEAMRKTPEIFAPNSVVPDAYTVIKGSLGTVNGNDASGAPVSRWDGLLHRTAAMLELMRVHAGLESSWNWNCGVDTANKTSLQNKTGQETGIFQVSFNSEWLDSTEGKDIMGNFAKATGIDTVEKFIPAMKENHPLAMEYYVRLVRVSIAWAGPLIRHGDNSVYPHLSRDSMREFMGLLK